MHKLEAVECVNPTVHSPFTSHECFNKSGHQFLLVTLSPHLIDQTKSFRCHILTQL